MRAAWTNTGAKWFLALMGCLATARVQLVVAAPDQAGRANPGFVVDVWTTENGLPQNEVTAILQTRDGYLWFGTHSGLVRFDGTRFAVFDESKTPGLTSSRIETLFEDQEVSLGWD